MPGKLPIDRVRQNEFAPKLQEEDKQRFARKQARLTNELLPPVDEAAGMPDDSPEVAGDATATDQAGPESQQG